MMQHRRCQQKQSTMLLRTNSCRQLSTIGSQSLKQRRSCRSTITSLPMAITTLIHSSSTTTTATSSTSSSPSSSYSCRLPSFFNRKNTNNNLKTNSGLSACSSVLLSLLAWSVTLLLISSCFCVAEARRSEQLIFLSHPLSKRSYINLGCKGVYDKSIFARLDRVCEDCYNLFREPTLHSLCRKDCFTTYYFKGCVESLLMQDEMEKFKMGIKQLNGADPGV